MNDWVRFVVVEYPKLLSAYHAAAHAGAKLLQALRDDEATLDVLPEETLGLLLDLGAAGKKVLDAQAHYLEAYPDSSQ